MQKSTRKLTQKAIDAAARTRDAVVAAGQPYSRQLLRDAEVPGFFATVHLESIAYSYSYKPRGRTAEGRRHGSRFVRIGDAASHSLIEARAIARELRRQVWRGEDPKGDAAREHEIRAAAEAAALVAARARVTCAARVISYRDVLRTRGRSAKHQANELSQLGMALRNGLGELTPTEITVPLIEAMLADCPAGVRSHRFSALSRFLVWACKGTGTVPATMMFDSHERPRPPPARKRVLTGPELAALWKAAACLTNPVAADLVQLCITTPCRRGEAAKMRWADIDFVGKVWSQPTSKNEDPHLFPLNARALAVLQRRRTATGGNPTDYVFPAALDITKPFTNWSDLLSFVTAEIDPATPVVGWRLHDVRRAFCTTLAEAGIDETLLDIAINHRASRTRGGIRSVYQRAIRWPERVQALAAWCDHLDRALGENIRPLHRGRR